jgi:tRNA(Ile)-lysidine synthase
MATRRHEDDDIVRAARDAFAGHARILIAVSGGLDSMVLLHAAASLPRNRRPAFLVASFDHGTGAAARRALDLVRRRSRELDLPFIAGHAEKQATTEHEWRIARWSFLRAQAARIGGPVATAHTLDDQIETVFMRILRDAGPRGLAALFAETEIVRPFLALKRSDIAEYAWTHRVTYA